MKKTLLILIAGVAGVAAACGNGEQTDGGGAENGETNELTVYSPHQTEIINPIISDFEQESGIRVNLVTGGTGDLLSRVTAEASNPLGDVFWGGGAESLEAHKEFFEPYVTSEDANIPDEYKSPTDHWVGFSALPMVIMYNGDLTEGLDVPDSWAGLLDEEWRGNIAYVSPNNSGSAYTQLVTMLFAHDSMEEGWEYAEQFYQQLDGKMLSSSSMVFQGVADGEFALGVTLEEAAYRYIEGGANVGVNYPTEGTSAVPDGMALIDGAKNKNSAEQFLDYLVSEEVQTKIVEDFSRRAVRDDVDPPEGLIPTDEIEMVDYDFEWSANEQDEVMSRFQQIVLNN